MCVCVCVWQALAVILFWLLLLVAFSVSLLCCVLWWLWQLLFVFCILVSPEVVVCLNIVCLNEISRQHVLCGLSELSQCNS